MSLRADDSQEPTYSGVFDSQRTDAYLKAETQKSINKKNNSWVL